jgi:hypothetical protein
MDESKDINREDYGKIRRFEMNCVLAEVNSFSNPPFISLDVRENIVPFSEF